MEISIRENLEREYLGLLLNREYLFNYVRIKPFYFSNKSLAILFEQLIECYQKYKLIDVTKIVEAHKNFNIELYTDLLTDIFVKPDYENQLLTLEDNILRYYKQDVIASLNEKLVKGDLNYDEFVLKIKKIDEIQIFKKVETLTEQEILDNINQDKVSIKIKNFDNLNTILKLVQGDFLIVGALTGTGKSGLLLNFMNGLMDNYQCIYFNMEMSKSTIYKRMISIRSGVPIYNIDNPATDYQKNIIQNCIKEISNKGVVIEHKANDIDTIKNVVRKVKNKEKHTILFIDHIGLVKKNGFKSLYESTTEVAKELRQICLDYDCTIISACQLNRGAYNSEQITLSMLKDSGEIENSSSKVILLYRDKKSNKDSKVEQMVLEVAKNRDGPYGLVCTNYIKEKQIFKEI